MLRDPVFTPAAGWPMACFLARVTTLDDPEGRSRVAVRLYGFDGTAGQDAELWARVVAPFAGDDRGAFFLPDVGDEVLVTFVQGDARHPLILGGLWSGAAAPRPRWSLAGATASSASGRAMAWW
jgi:uncharacterized protein involved in type VI secretion and phage assembly